MDFVNITDSAANDTRKGNIGFLQRNYRQGTFELEFRFGRLLASGLAGTLPARSTSTTNDFSAVWAQIRALWDAIDDLAANQALIIDLLLELRNRTEFTHLSVTERFQGPTGAGKTG